MNTSRLRWIGAGALMLAMIGGSAAQQPKEHAFKVGKKGEITLKQPTRAGDRLLQPGTYVVQHRGSGEDHFVRFVALKEVGPTWPAKGHYTYTVEEKAGEIKCRVEPAAGPIKKTIVYTVSEDGVQRITKVAIKGETVLHVLETKP